MGTNFYLFTEKKELKQYFGQKVTIVDDPEFGYEIHIAKTSAGWRPSFEAHDNIRSVADIKLLYDMGGVKIYDEYGTEYNWNEFVDRVVEFGNKLNWRTLENNEYRRYSNLEFISIDGYRFSEREFC